MKTGEFTITTTRKDEIYEVRGISIKHVEQHTGSWTMSIDNKNFPNALKALQDLAGEQAKPKFIKLPDAKSFQRKIRIDGTDPQIMYDSRNYWESVEYDDWISVARIALAAGQIKDMEG